MEAILDHEQAVVDDLLQALYAEFGYDYRNYANRSIIRRIRRRMTMENIGDTALFCRRVMEDGRLRDNLVSDFSLLVTKMFRDPGFFRAFRKHVVPHLRNLPYIRIWHAGCATGEEVYSMCILLMEEGLLKQSRIYATDIHEDALLRAESGRIRTDRMQAYTRSYMQAGGRDDFSRYYTVHGREAQFHPELLSRVVFMKHNLATDHAFQRFHVVICRNVLIYFNQMLKERAHRMFIESLGEQGFLMLGNKESVFLCSQANLYETIDGDEKIYRIKEGFFW